VLVAAVLLVAADVVGRAGAEGVAARQIEQRLPDGVHGDVAVRIRGFSFLWQLAHGRFDEVDVDAPSLQVAGSRLPVRITAHGVPTDLSSVGRMKARVTVGPRLVNKIATIPAAVGRIRLGHGVVVFDGSRSAFGLTVNYRLAATPVAAGDRLLLSPAHAKITTGPVGLDFSSVIKQLLASKPIPICLAQYLPAGLDVTDVRVQPGAARLTVTAHDFHLDEHSLTRHGRCH